MEEISIGLWKKTSQKGTEYYKGSKYGVEINGKKYKVSLFQNNNKNTDKSPDMTIKLNEITESNDTEDYSNMSTKTEYEEKEIVIKPDDLPF